MHVRRVPRLWSEVPAIVRTRLRCCASSHWVDTQTQRAGFLALLARSRYRLRAETSGLVLSMTTDFPLDSAATYEQHRECAGKREPRTQTTKAWDASVGGRYPTARAAAEANTPSNVLARHLSAVLSVSWLIHS